MSRAWWSALVTVLLTMLAPLPTSAETVVCGATVDANSPLGWTSAQAAAGNDDNAAALRILKERYHAAALTWPASIARPAAEAFAALDAGADKVANFEVTKSGQNPLALQQGVFHGQPYFVELPIDTQSPLCSPQEIKNARIQYATVIQGVSDAVGAFGAQAIGLAADRVVELEATFDRYLFEGFPMFPWEAAVNSWLLTRDHLVDGPPRQQIVLAHPAAGMVISSADDAKSDTGATLSIEPLGWVHYSKDYRHWMGVSLVAVFPADRDAGYGVAFNYDMFKFGVTWHDDDTGEHDGAAVFLGLDLYKFLDAKYREYDGYRDRVRALAQPPPPPSP
jgi:hypothetical protein